MIKNVRIDIEEIPGLGVHVLFRHVNQRHENGKPIWECYRESVYCRDGDAATAIRKTVPSLFDKLKSEKTI